MSDEEQGTQAQEQVQATKGKTKGKTSGDVIVDIASEVESLTKAKALKEARDLVEQVETDYFKLGGVLKRIYENSWFEGYDSFGALVAKEFGFQERKAKYLMEIYTNLVDKQIPWSKVSVLGWSKLKELTKVLTVENVDEWVAKAKDISVIELQALLKPASEGGDTASGKTSSDTVALKFSFKPDALETVQAALSKAKAETGTEYDNVALENVMSGYLAGSVGGGADLGALMKSAGYEAVLELFDKLWPEINLEVSLPD